jgi:hypothetical protein
VTLNDLQRAFELARSKPRHLVPKPKVSFAPRAGLDGVIDSLLATQHVLEDVPPLAAKRHFPTSPRPALQPPHQNSYRSTQARDALRMGRDWPVMSDNRTCSYSDLLIRLDRTDQFTGEVSLGFRRKLSKVLKIMVGPWGLEPQTSTDTGHHRRFMGSGCGTDCAGLCCDRMRRRQETDRAPPPRH